MKKAEFKDKNNTSDEVKATEIHKEKKGKKYLNGLISLAVYFAVFSLTIIISELFIRYQISGRILKMNLAFLAFVPAEAMFFTAFAGFFKNLGNKITTPILLLIIPKFLIADGYDPVLIHGPDDILKVIACRRHRICYDTILLFESICEKHPL